MNDPEPEATWPPRGDGGVWAGIAAGGLLPLLAQLLDAPFWWAWEGQFVATPPLAWAVVQPVLAAALWLGSPWGFRLAMWLQLPLGLALLWSLLQAPTAFLALGGSSAPSAPSYAALGLSYALALATGMVSTALCAYLLRLSLRSPPARGASADSGRAPRA